VPAAIRWPGVIHPGTVSNEIFSHQDMLPTLLAAAGEPDIVEKCRKGYIVGNKTFRVQLDGFNLMPYLKGQAQASPRAAFLYWSDAGDLVALRYDNWKVHFAVQYSEGIEAWQEPLEQLTFPMLINLRADPFESAEVAADHSYKNWRSACASALEPAAALIGQCIKTLKEFPPHQRLSRRPGAVIEKLKRHQETLEAGLGERHLTAR
jgi:arylsulfatase